MTVTPISDPLFSSSQKARGNLPARLHYLAPYIDSHVFHDIVGGLRFTGKSHDFLRPAPYHLSFPMASVSTEPLPAEHYLLGTRLLISSGILRTVTGCLTEILRTLGATSYRIHTSVGMVLRIVRLMWVHSNIKVVPSRHIVTGLPLHPILPISAEGVF